MFHEKKKIVDLLESKIIKMNKKRGLEFFLWLLSIFFATQIYSSINGPIKFNQVKNERYTQVIDRLKDIRNAQIAHKDVRGFYANNFDSLVSFIDDHGKTPTEKLLAPSILRNLKSFGEDVEEDITWLMK